MKLNKLDTMEDNIQSIRNVIQLVQNVCEKVKRENDALKLKVTEQQKTIVNIRKDMNNEIL